MKFLALLFLIQAVLGDPVPVVLWHGMGDTCCVSFSLGSFKLWLENQIPGVYVLSLRLGNNAVEDFENGYFMNPNEQMDHVCNVLATDPKLKGGFNMIGFSQGSQLLRGTLQKCGHKLPQVKNLISLGGQHQGIYGIPNCGPVTHKTCDYIRKLLNYAAYVRLILPLHVQMMNAILFGAVRKPESLPPTTDSLWFHIKGETISWVQDSLVQATYWHDPLDEVKYKNKSIFLADINNERVVNETYIQNLNALEHFVMVKFKKDSIVQPRESEWFGFYVPGQSQKLQTLRDSDLYKTDRLGLKKMDTDGKLVFLTVDGDHLQFQDDWFIDNIIKPYLL